MISSVAFVQWACTTSVDFSLAQLIQVMILLSTGGANGGGYLASKYVVLAIYTAILIVHGLINSLPIQWLSWFGQLGAFWNVAGRMIHPIVSMYCGIYIRSTTNVFKIYLMVFQKRKIYLIVCSI